MKPEKPDFLLGASEVREWREAVYFQIGVDELIIRLPTGSEQCSLESYEMFANEAGLGDV